MEENKDWGTEDETPHTNPGTWYAHRRWRTDGKKEENKERIRKRISNPATLDPSVAFYDPQGSYGESILVTPTAQRENGHWLITIINRNTVLPEL